MVMDYVSHSDKETQALAGKVLDQVRQAGVNVIAMYGDLGAGKTTLVQGLAQALGVSRTVSSPTFILVREYQLKSGWDRLYHVDLYRLGSAEEIKSIDLTEWWQDPKNLVVIEWAEKVEAGLPKPRLEVKMKYRDEQTREVKSGIIN